MRTLAVALLLSGAMMWAQSNTPQTPPAGSQGQTGAGSSQSAPAGHAGMHQGMHRGQMGGMGMGQQHMQDMKAMMEQLRSKMDRMRTALPNVKDPAAKEALQADYDIWQSFYSHLQQMQAGMQEHMNQQGSGSSSQPSSGQTPPPQR